MQPWSTVIDLVVDLKYTARHIDKLGVTWYVICSFVRLKVRFLSLPWHHGSLKTNLKFMNLLR